MDDSDGDGVYTVTVDIEPDTIEYSSRWTDGPLRRSSPVASSTSTIDGFVNRSYVVDGDATSRRSLQL